MFNNNLKKEALKSHEEIIKKYNNSHELMSKACEELYAIRLKAIGTINLTQEVINSIANTPKEFSTELGEVKTELSNFKKTEEYAAEAYETAKKSGVNLAAGIGTGIGVASAAPSILMSIATTFGTASTGTAISALSGAAAKKAAVAWIGRVLAGFAVKSGAGMAVGNVVLALAGPIGWGITIASTTTTFWSLSKKNKKLAEEALKEAKEIDNSRKSLDLMTEKIKSLKAKIDTIDNNFTAQRDKILEFKNADFQLVSEDDKHYLGSLVNNTLALSKLLNEVIE